MGLAPLAALRTQSACRCDTCFHNDIDGLFKKGVLGKRGIAVVRALSSALRFDIDVLRRAEDISQVLYDLKALAVFDEGSLKTEGARIL